MKAYIFFVTVPNYEEGRKIATYLVEKQVVACVNIIQNVVSIYRWKEKVEESNEALLIIKTMEKNNEELINAIKKLHSYEIPECIGFKIEKGSPQYLKWLFDSIKERD
jgi:periplasmic divalent cation tolerance protein